MSLQLVEQGIAALQAGRAEEGIRLLKIALKSAEVAGSVRAIACLWLAETAPDAASKRAYYNDALAADPNNPDIRQRVERWRATQLPAPPAAPPPSIQPPMPPSAGTTSTGSYPMVTPTASSLFSTQAPAPPSALPGIGAMLTNPQPAASGLYQIVGVIGGPNGPGTAFFISRDGLLATSRYVTGGLERLTIELETGRQIPGRVVRSYPELDLAFIYVEQAVNELMPVTPLPRIPEETLLSAISYNGQVARGKRRATKRVLSPHWFPTDITRMPDAGGCPALDDRHYLVGMLTRNTSSSSSHVYGLHISAIRRYMETFWQEASSGGRVYCATCGYLSRAAANGGYYCESCGTLMPQAENIRRYPHPQTSGFYYEQGRIACMHCNATVGFHNGACLRCGRTPDVRR